MFCGACCDGDGNEWECGSGDALKTRLPSPVVSLASAANASGKFGGVAGVFAGVHSCKKNRYNIHHNSFI